MNDQDSNNIVVSQDFQPTQQSPVPNNIPSEPRSNKLKVVVLVVAIIAVVGIVSGVLYTKRGIQTVALNGQTISIVNSPVVVETQFLNDLFVGNFKGAYSLTSTNFQAAQSEPVFASYEKTIQISQLKISSLKTSSVNGGEVISGNINIQNHTLFSFGSKLVQQDFLWKINNFEIN